MGSTASVVAIGSGMIACANAGDSRTVLVRTRRDGAAAALALSRDHSPASRPDEVARIEAAGGVLAVGDPIARLLASLSPGPACNAGGCLRVYHGASGAGGLNMTRAIGDSYLRPLVIPDPELVREPCWGPSSSPPPGAAAAAAAAAGEGAGAGGAVSEGDAFVVLATDGLWDVISSDEAAELIGRLVAAADARRRNRERDDFDLGAGGGQGGEVGRLVREGAVALARGAQQRGSTDNITVMVARVPPCPVPSPAWVPNQTRSARPSPGVSAQAGPDLEMAND